MKEFENEKCAIKIKNIKSAFIIKKIFSFLDAKIKWNIIIYNQEFQKIISVDLDDYKKKSGKYKIGEKNWRGKEYNSEGKLIFEGEYLNGKRNEMELE